jgi:hypothetical protein
MLRESIEFAGESIDLEGLTDLACSRIEGIPHSEALMRFADAFMGKDTAALVDARETLVKEMSPEALVDAAGVASNFQRMVRIADGTGIPSDDIMAVMQEEFCEKLGINEYGSASNTKPLSWFRRLVVKLILIPKFKRTLKERSS